MSDEYYSLESFEPWSEQFNKFGYDLSELGLNETEKRINIVDESVPVYVLEIPADRYQLISVNNGLEGLVYESWESIDVVVDFTAGIVMLFHCKVVHDVYYINTCKLLDIKRF